MRHDRSKAERSLARYKGDEIVKDVSRKYARFNQESVKRCVQHNPYSLYADKKGDKADESGSGD